MQKCGTQADNVLELEVVTGAGDLVTCSPRQHRRLFMAVVAGCGQVALIVRAKVRLLPAPPSALVFHLFYDDLVAYVDDQTRLVRDGRFDSQAGQLAWREDHTGVALDRGMPPSAVPAAGLRRTSGTTVWGPVAGIHACLPLLERSAAGRMVHVSSAWGARAQQSYPACECRHLTRLAGHASQTALHAVTMPFAQALQDTPLPATPRPTAIPPGGRRPSRRARRRWYGWRRASATAPCRGDTAHAVHVSTAAPGACATR